MTAPKPLLAFNGQGIPEVLRASKRWAPWKAVWSEKRGKYDKIPVRADQPEYNLSTANPARWFEFNAAIAAHNTAQGMTAGVGYVMTKPHGVVGVDLDGCLDEHGATEPWASEIVDMLGGYAEYSPSGTGLRVFVRGAIPYDWVNHSVGVECYAGHKPRFLTVTGRRLEGSPEDVPQATEGALAWLEEKYHDKSPPKHGGELAPVPLLLPDEELPSIEDLGLPRFAETFLKEGPSLEVGDRSTHMAGVAHALLGAGLNEVQALSVLASNFYAYEVALDHRNQDHDKALVYLWHHHVLAAKEKMAERAVLSLSDVQDLVAAGTREGPPPGSGTVGAVASAAVAAAASLGLDGAAPGELGGSVSDFADLIEAMPVKPSPIELPPFTPIQVAEYVRIHTPVEWFIYGVLPKAEICAVIGDSGSGKTFFVLDMALKIAAGMQWRNKRTRKGRVVYVAAEGAQGIKTRVDAWARHHGVALQDIDMHIIGAAPSLLSPVDVKALLRALSRLGKIDLIVLDTLAQVTPGAAENSSEDMGKALAHCKTLHAAIKATILLVGHTGKDASRGLRGWSGIRAAMDSMIEVVRLQQCRGATISKLKDGKGEGDEYFFKLETLDLDYDFEYDEPITSCVVVPLDEKQAAKAKRGAQIKGEWELMVMNAAEDEWGFSEKPFKEGDFIEKVVAEAKDRPRARDNINRALAKLIEKGALVSAAGMLAVP